MSLSFKRITKKQQIILAIVSVVLLLAIVALDCRLLIRRYAIEAEEITAPIRIVLITDLHDCRYGKEQKQLLAAVAEQQPDLILLVGDIYDDIRDHTPTEQLLRGLSDAYPCYYVSGNHEVWLGAEKYAALLEHLQTTYGITVLHGTSITLDINGTTVNLCGIDDPAADTVTGAAFTERLQSLSPITQNGNFTILMSHRPEYFETAYQAGGFDLVLCGHAHGGQFRIPGILNGLYAPHQGMFPPYAGGMFSQNGTTMIVSRGLARESTPIPRIFNRPELVVIDLS